MSGIDLCHAGLKKMDRAKNALLTGYLDEIDETEFGATVVFAKPFSIDEFERGKRLPPPRPNEYRLAA
jgi:hypothetical protein